MKTHFGFIRTVIPSTPFCLCPDWAPTPARQGVSALTQMLDWELAEDQGPVWEFSIQIVKAIAHRDSDFLLEALQAETVAGSAILD